jgi:hypothetical protein
MRRFAVLSALLLPLPFAALPLLAIVFDHDDAVAPEGVVVTTQAPPGSAGDTISISARENSDESLAFTHGGCGQDPVASAGGAGTSGS